MLTPQIQRRLFTRAQSLAERLIGGGVSRAELRCVLNPLFLPAEPWARRLDTARRLLEALPLSWVADRTKQTRSQLLRVREVVGELLRGNPDEQELRYLLGWTARLVHTRDLEARQRTESREPRGGDRGRRDQPRHDPRPGPAGKRRP